MTNDDNKAFNINPSFVKRQKKGRSLHYYLDGLQKGDRYVLSEAITLVESDDIVKCEIAAELLTKIHSLNKNNTLRIAITGSPGVGKSTFIEYFGHYLADKGEKLAVLAIDPSSQLYKGSILGDKTRMQELSIHDNVYIRPSSAGTMLGGVAKGTKEAILLCEAAGYNTIFIETVGVGQSEFWASMMVDATILLIQPGGGDEIQGIKRGIMEMADLLVINKADGQLKNTATQTAKAYESVLPLFQPKFSTNFVQTSIVSSIEQFGFDDVWSKILAYKKRANDANYFYTNRKNQEIFWFENMIKEIVFNVLLKNENFSDKLINVKKQIDEGNLSASNAFYVLEKEINQAIQNEK